LDIAEAQAARALVQLRAEGWVVSPKLARDEWRKAIRAYARRAGLQVRTGESPCTNGFEDREPRPWAATVEHYETMRALMGGLSLETLGIVLVNTDAETHSGEVPWWLSMPASAWLANNAVGPPPAALAPESIA